MKKQLFSKKIQKSKSIPLNYFYLNPDSNIKFWNIEFQTLE